MNAVQAPVSLLDIGRRIHSIDAEYHAIEDIQMGKPAGSREYCVAHEGLVALVDEQTALQDLALAMQARTLSDAAVQLGVLFDLLVEICVPDLLSQVQSNDLARDLARLKRALAGIRLVVAKAAGLEPALVAEAVAARASCYPAEDC
jgi:hypothetical protein